MKGRYCLKGRLIAVKVIFFVIFFSGIAYACGGIDLIINDNPERLADRVVPGKKGTAYFTDTGQLVIPTSDIKVSPQTARMMVERFVRERIPAFKSKFRFRKLEYVHGRIIYQFESLDRLRNYNGKYHLGPVNFIVDHLILDVDAKTGEIFLANGCGAAPGQLLARYNPSDFSVAGSSGSDLFISNNTNFIARKTGNAVKIDGIIDEKEWKETGHRYFYIGQYRPHKPSEAHKKPFYHVEVWSQIDERNIYFAVKTDSPYWIGLLFKDNPNLGMLWSYKDAKVMKSNGEITDRHFMQRKDKTYFLEKDKKDDIIAASSRQDNLYTYEFAFPLRTGDRDDIDFQEGRAYNMLVLVGNTLEHYGIFTLDDAHKNHDHSKNNKEHADVWASAETTLRIASAPKTDIFGRTVSPVFASYVSGFDPSRNDTHFHYAQRTVKDIKNRSVLTQYINLFTILIGLFGMAFMFVRMNGDKVTDIASPVEIDLFRFKSLRRFLISPYYRMIFTIPVFLVFIVIVVAGILDVQDGRRNIATVYTWTLWWSLIIFSFIFVGRLWCMICPFAFAGDIAQRLISFKKTLPRWLQNMGFQILAFVALTFAYAHFSLYNKPFATSLLIIGILIAAVLTSVIYKRRTFCRYLCPIGAVIGLYSLVSPFRVQPSRDRVCINHREKTCSRECPMLEDPYNMDSNLYCNYCMKCIPACPSGNLRLKLRGMGRDIYEGLRRSSIEAIASLLLFGIVLYETLAMTSSLSAIQKLVSSITAAPQGIVSGITYLVVISLPAVVFLFACYGLSKWMDRDELTPGVLLKNFAFTFIPLGIGLHLAHNLRHLFVEGPVAVPATVRLLQKAGVFDTGFMNWNPLPLLGGSLMFFLQIVTVITGFVFTLYLLCRVMKRLHISTQGLLKTVFVMTLYAVMTVSITFYMIGLPMNGRHVH